MYPTHETIKSLDDLKYHYNEISKQCHQNHEVALISVNEQFDTVLLTYEDYQNKKAKIELLELLLEANDDIQNQRVAPMQDTFTKLKRMLKQK